MNCRAGGCGDIVESEAAFALGAASISPRNSAAISAHSTQRKLLRAGSWRTNRTMPLSPYCACNTP
jgi:hypothetical protein